MQKSLLPDQVAQERKDTRHLNTQTIKQQLLEGVQFFFPLERKDNSRLTFAYFVRQTLSLQPFRQLSDEERPMKVGRIK